MQHPTFRQAFWVWAKIAILSFGGPTGQIALMHREVVERRRWLSDARFLHALNYCMLLPGPEAQQLSIYIGWLMHHAWGGLVAGVLFVVPGALLLWAISVVYVVYGKLPAVEAIFYGLKPAVMAIVAAAVLRIGRKALKNRVMVAISAVSFIAIFFLRAPFPLIVLAAGLGGLAGGRLWPSVFAIPVGHAASGAHAGGETVIRDDAAAGLRPPTLARSLAVALGWIVVWLAPVVAALAALGPDHVLVHEGVFFAKAAIVTFGGAYAVLPYVAQQAVETYGWLGAEQMMDGLALAETTPGPLILVLQFVGFLGGWHQPGGFSPMAAATLAAALTTWVTFAPCFGFIFVGAPYIERMRGNLRLDAALSAITAAVVGVVLNLAVWFAGTVLFPDGGALDWFPLVGGIAAFVAIERFKVDVIPIILAAAAAGLLVSRRFIVG